ncbi:MAG: hypothetical protein MUE65_04090 [Methanomassiliicoccales archaeon]|nr:hypothetical protein [Methanomassiliicoccales archaeon]
MRKGRALILGAGAVVVALSLIALVAFLPASAPPQRVEKSRASAIPTDAVKWTPSMDEHPPILHSDEFQGPIPVPGPINTAGAEDSPFILPDGSSLYFFFTPDVRKAPEEQLMDGVSGIWRSDWNGSAWSEPVRVWLQDAGKLALDGAAFVGGGEIWFASAREGYEGVNLFIATEDGEGWKDWRFAGEQLNEQYQAGEMHITSDGGRIYFHSSRPGGSGGLDIWYCDRSLDGWQQPVLVEEVSSIDNEGWPFVSQDGSELWFTRTHMGSPGIFRSLWNGSAWGAPELMVSTLAGEPTLDQEGNLYFVHHYYQGMTMVEADIYVCYRN